MLTFRSRFGTPDSSRNRFVAAGARTARRLLASVGISAVKPVGAGLLAAMAVVAGFGSPVSAQSIFPDKNLEVAVRKEVFEKRNNDQPIVEADVPNISQVVGRGRDGKKVASLAGLEKCRSIAAVELDLNEIADLAPLKDLKNIQLLSLRGNKVKDLSPLASLTNLQYLQLENNEVEDLAPLAGLANLRSLYLTNNKIKSVAPLANLKKLWSLYLGGNQITDLKPLAELKNLDTIGLEGNGISDIAPLAGLSPSKFLFLQRNQLTDLGVLVEMAKKDAAGEKRFAPFWYVDVTGNPLSDAAKNAQLGELRKLGVPERIILK